MMPAVEKTFIASEAESHLNELLQKISAVADAVGVVNPPSVGGWVRGPGLGTPD
jgi:hypothetical protein